MRRFLLILLVLALALMTGVSVLAQEDTSGESTIHVVQAGENVYRISLQYGVTIDAIHITTSATCTDVLNFEEWAQDGTSATSTVEEITLSGTFTEDDGTLADASIAADGRLMVDLPATPTDIAFYEITVIYHAN